MEKSCAKQAGCKTSLPVAQLRKTDLHAAKTDLKQAFKESKSFSTADGSMVLHSEPFQCCTVANFIVDDNRTDFLQSLKDELLNLHFYEKSNDLYKFHQSNDLKKVNTPYIASLRKLLYGEFREWLQDVCGFKLNETVDMSCARYDYTDVLLCHDDQLEGRRIAYIYYLVPPVWETKDGGALQLFSCDENGDPSTVTRSIYPEWNSFVFFPVTPKSFHQVTEVLTEDKTRLSISGWFYGEPIEYPSRASDVALANLTTPIMLDEEIMSDWLNPKYFDHWSMLDIRLQKFERDSEVLLLDFLNEDKFKAVSEALKQLEWTTQGPPNKRNFETANTNITLPEVLRTFLDVLHSDAMFYMLSTATGLKLHELASEEESSSSEHSSSSSSSSSSYGEPKSKTSKVEAKRAKNTNHTAAVNPKCDTEIRRFKHGSYTLLHDRDLENTEFSLDVIMFFNCEEWQSEYGGFISYVAKDEDDELLTVNPEANGLALVYRDKETLRFVKHVNHRSVAATNTGRPSEFHAIWSKFYK